MKDCNRELVMDTFKDTHKLYTHTKRLVLCVMYALIKYRTVSVLLAQNG